MSVTAVSKQFFEPVLPWLISAAFLGLALGAMSSVASSAADSSAAGPPGAVNDLFERSVLLEPSLLSSSAVTTWHNSCRPQRVVITGAGMGDAPSTLNPQTVHPANPDRINSLLVQVAGRYTGTRQTPKSVVFSSELESVSVSSPTTETGQGYSFETRLQPTGQLTAWVNQVGDTFKTPRGLIAYAWQATAGEPWTSVGQTMNAYVYHKNGEEAHSELLAFEALAGSRDLEITAVVIDNNEDERPLVVEAAAGPVVASQTFTGPTEGPLLNIVSLRLPDVPTGTDRVTVTTRSPAENGDSLVLMGVNVSYECNPGDNTGIYLPIVLKGYCVPFTDTFSSELTNWPRVDNEILKTEYQNDEYRIVTKRTELHYVYNRSFAQYYQNYEIEVDARWARNGSTGKGYGIFFGLASDESRTYLFQVNADRGLYRLLLLLDGAWKYYENNGWHKSTDLENGWVFTNVILTGTHTNHLKVIRSGLDIKLSANGQPLLEVTDGIISAGRVGLTIERYDDDQDYGTRNADARFDNYIFDLCNVPRNDISSLGSNYFLLNKPTGTLPSTD